jgi:hypothetical protein
VCWGERNETNIYITFITVPQFVLNLGTELYFNLVAWGGFGKIKLFEIIFTKIKSQNHPSD